MENLRKLVDIYLHEQILIAKDFPIEDTANLMKLVIKTYDNDGTLFTFANGGPSGCAEGFATDLKTHPFVMEDKSITSDKRRFKVHCLNESCGVITGISNDIGYHGIFKEQLKNYMRNKEKNQNDLVIGFSGSGNSKNVLEAFNYAKKFGVKTACITGSNGGKSKEIVDICIRIPGSSKYPGQTGKNDNNFHIEDFQTSITHMVTGALKEHVWT